MQAAYGSLEHPSALAQDGDLVAHQFHLTQQVGVEKHGHATFIAQAQDEIPEPFDALGIEAIGRLVEQQQFGLRQQRLGESQPLAHAVAVGADFRVDAGGEPHLLHRHAGRTGIEAAGISHQQAQVFPTAEVFIKCGRLEDRAHLAQCPRSVCQNGDAADGDLTGIRHHHAEDDAESGAFACAVVA